ncbi:hypothetical protein O7627_12485 [Solwaraspora sp. WMMD1047]|uniref:hypothetical protein n=1 Tax=Solwaraspora sp. WMMD1047 TaxID=3016102 RepID=UPI00241677CD|nr:hypothetical protein [Solwaraspora sp. WMMD1047]MDG4830115.1 hypothetical protein [Solwaraspora sp. WMMD1047]
MGFGFQGGELLGRLAVSLRQFTGATVGVEIVEVLVGNLLHVALRDSSGVGQQSALVEIQEAVGLDHPFGHPDLLAPPGPVLPEVEEHRGQPVQLIQLARVQVVLRHGHVALPHPGSGPVGQPMFGAFARTTMSSAAVWPVTAYTNLLDCREEGAGQVA